jgi:hypothetical protein
MHGGNDTFCFSIKELSIWSTVYVPDQQEIIFPKIIGEKMSFRRCASINLSLCLTDRSAPNSVYCTGL